MTTARREDESDAALIARARDGDESALEALFERYTRQVEARVRGWLSPAVQRKVSAADVVQEACIVAHRRLASFEDRGDGSFGQWLARIARNKARHAVRRFVGTDKRGAEEEVTRGRRPETANLPGNAPTPSQAAMHDELAERTRRALASLPPDYREAIRLRQEEHLTMQEVADRMGRSKGAVEKLYARGLARLAEILDLKPGGGS